MTVQAKRVLLVDDEEKLLESISRRLTLQGFVPYTATDGMRAIEIAKTKSIDLAIVDLQMPDMDGLVTITKLKEIIPNLKTILLTGHGNDKVKQATESLNSLYFEKDEMNSFWSFIKKMNTDGKVVVIRPSPSDSGGGGLSGTPAENEIAIHPHADLLEANYRERGFSEEGVHSIKFKNLRIVGETPAMQEVRKNIERAASLDCPVTICGQPGTGKELAARNIHAGSMRRKQPFLVINCANFGNEQLARQLLGYQKGDLYEAARTRSGIFSAGQMGTLLFDQIEEMPDNMQAQLLKILAVSASDQHAGLADIRILATTAADLQGRIRARSFNKRLFEQLKLIELTIPPLKERKDDIPPLCQYFFDKYRREMGKHIDTISPEVIKILVNYGFPGNVGELEHIVERAVILAEGNTIERKHLPTRFLKDIETARPLELGQLLTLAELEKRHILEVLEATQGNKSKTAKILGISRAALWRKLKQFKSEQPDQ
jgi:DNA-binding NtrC family response regulator